MKHGKFVKYSRTSRKYFYSATKDRYWEFLCSKYNMTISADRTSKRDFIILQVLRTWFQLGRYFLFENLFKIHRLIGPKKWCWYQVEIIRGHNKEVSHNITIKIPSWATYISYSKNDKKCIFILGMEPRRIG